jgi:CHAT domain-containing protein
LVESNEDVSDKRASTAKSGKDSKKLKNESYHKNESIKRETLPTKQQPAKQQNAEQQNAKGIILIIVIVFICIIVRMYRRKCRQCKKWNAMKRVRKELVDEKPSTIVKNRTKKNGKGEVICTYQVDVPATTYHYHIHRQCKHCGYKDYKTKSETREN